MDSSFATAIAPILTTALELLEEIKRRPTDWDVGQIRNAQMRIEKSLEKAQRQLKARDESSWNRIKYALVAWIDEQCISLPWQGADWWKNNSLEVVCFRSKNSHNDFYVHAEDAIRKNDQNAIETYFLCVVLGFRGIYIDLRSQDPEYVERAKDFIRRFHLKSDLRDWLKRLSEYIPIGQSSTRLEVEPVEAFGAPPLNARTDFVSSVFFACIGLGVLLGYLLFKYEWLS